jgi:dTDP-4-amino-4,6-dideoxygalactose transaminase
MPDGQASRIPLNDLGRYANSIADALATCAGRVLASGHFVLGPNVAAFEEAFAAYCGVSSCIGVANGTDALELSLRACGVHRDDRVVVCANAAMYGTGAVLAIGALPVFADVGNDGLITVSGLEAAIASTDVRPRAVIITHLYGRLADLDGLLAVAKRYGLRVIEDCAQAHGAMRNHRKAGSWGDAAAFSFYPTKNLGAIGDGGAVVTSDGEIAGRVRQLRQYGWSSKYRNSLAGGRNSRLDEIQAAFLLRMLQDLDRRNERRRQIAQRYSRSIQHPSIDVPAAGGPDYVAHLYVLRSPARDALAAHLAERGIATDVHYPIPDHRQPILADTHASTSLPTTEKLCAESLTLPCFPELSDAECKAVIAACNGWNPA